MKKIIKKSIFFVFFLVCLGVCIGCKNTKKPTEYTIQYIDFLGVHTLTVKNGSVYSIKIPEKTGYEFLGLFDEEVGGVQYVSSSGSSLSPFTDNKNLNLFAQYKAKEYTLVLDYQGATVSGVRSVSVSYNSKIEELPTNVELKNKDFMGWFTKPNCQGVQVSDHYGIIPLSNIVNEKLFDLSNTENGIYLYAGFENKKYTVTFYFEDNNKPEEILVEHGTLISEVIPTTRVNGLAVLSWSKTKNDVDKTNVFDGKVESDMILYANEYAPIIDFDVNGGVEINSIISRAGSEIVLPTPYKDNYQFVCWKDESDNEYNIETMPSESIKLKAKWQSKIIFNPNGGTFVKSISVPAGNNVTLPTTKRENYVFAGWYTSDGKKYTSTTMPSQSLILKAGWHEVKEETVYIWDASKNYKFNNYMTTSGLTKKELRNEWTLDMSKFLSPNYRGKIKIDANIKYSCGSASISEPSYIYLNFYSTDVLSDNYLIYNTQFKVSSSSYEKYKYSFETELMGNKIYCAAWCSLIPYGTAASDYYYTVTYEDYTNLIL